MRWLGAARAARAAVSDQDGVCEMVSKSRGGARLDSQQCWTRRASPVHEESVWPPRLPCGVGGGSVRRGEGVAPLTWLPWAVFDEESVVSKLVNPENKASPPPPQPSPPPPPLTTTPLPPHAHGPAACLGPPETCTCVCWGCVRARVRARRLPVLAEIVTGPLKGKGQGAPLQRGRAVEPLRRGPLL